MRKNISGFTIVELLIVIVVIAILASVTVASFQGFQQRSYASRAATTANAYAKLLLMYKADYGVFPAGPPLTAPAYGEACLGKATDYPLNGGFQSGTCMYRVGGWNNKVDVLPSLISDLSPYGTLPDASLERIEFSTNSFWRGIIYQRYSDPKWAALIWVLRGNHLNTCPGTGSIYFASVNYTQRWLELS